MPFLTLSAGKTSNLQLRQSIILAYCGLLLDLSLVAQVGKKLPRGSIKLELKSLKLLSLQASLRSQVEKEQGDIMNMGDKAYRKFARNCQASRSHFDRTVSFFAAAAGKCDQSTAACEHQGLTVPLFDALCREHRCLSSSPLTDTVLHHLQTI